MNIDELLSGGGLEGLMEQAREMQNQMQQAQARAGELKVTGEAGGGMVRVTANGKMEVLQVTIDPVVAGGDDLEMLQDLVTAAVNDALRRAREAVTRELGPLAEVMKASGLGM